MAENERSAFDGGKLAALQGCYRILVCPENAAEEAEWMRGYDSVPAEQRGTVPRPEPLKPAALGEWDA